MNNPEKSTGQLCYEAFSLSWIPDASLNWDELAPSTREAWQRAANAVALYLAGVAAPGREGNALASAHVEIAQQPTAADSIIGSGDPISTTTAQQTGHDS